MPARSPSGRSRRPGGGEAPRDRESPREPGEDRDAHRARGARGRPGASARRRPAAVEASPDEGRLEKVQKVLARAGVASRRAVEELVAQGRVRVNGEVARLGQRVDPERDLLEVDGAVVATRSDLVHYLLHKPPGVVTTARDPQGRPTVVDLVPAEPRVFPVGRLDVDTEGLLLLTNDGELAHRLTHPRYGVEKEYLAEVIGTPSRGALRRLREGVELDDGPTAPAKASLLGDGLLRIVVHEGRKRQVRRMCEAVGHPVVRLVRTRIGPITDTKLRPGEWRHLTREEVQALARAAAVPSR